MATPTKKRAPLVDPLADLFAAVEAADAGSSSSPASSTLSPAGRKRRGDGGDGGIALVTDGDDPTDVSWAQPPPTIWSTIKAQVKPVEVDAVKRALGSDVIERNEDIFSEAVAFADILKDFKARNEKSLALLESRPKLPPTAAQRMLQQQIGLLLKSVRPKTRDGRPPIESDSDRRVYEFVTGESSGAGLRRPMSASSMRRPGSVKSAPEQLEDVGAVDVFNIDKVVGNIRRAMHDEKQLLLDHIEFLQLCLEEEKDMHEAAKSEVTAAPPAVQELRQFEEKLQKQLHDDESHAQTSALLAPVPRGKSGSFRGLGKAPLGSLPLGAIDSSSSSSNGKRNGGSRGAGGKFGEDGDASGGDLSEASGDEAFLGDGPGGDSSEGGPHAPPSAGRRGGHSRPAGPFSPEAKERRRHSSGERSGKSRSRVAKGTRREAAAGGDAAGETDRTTDHMPPVVAPPRRSRSQRLRDEIMEIRHLT